MKKLMNLKQDKKGFTLIEIVIVLVIIAILAAMLIPSMMGWIDDSRQKSFLSEANSVKTAVEAEIVVAYAAGDPYDTAANLEVDPHWNNIKDKLGADVSPTAAAGSSKATWVVDATTKKISEFTYTGTDYTAVYTVAGGEWDVTKN